MSYTKLFSSIVTSTIWTEDATTCKVWVTMLAIADKHGEVHASIPGLAQIAGLPVTAVIQSVEKFLSPDRYSRTPDDEGRRIEKIDGGWMLLNHAKYRAMASKDEEKSASAKRQAAFKDRQRRNAKVTESNGEVTESNGEVTESNDRVTPNRDIAEAEAEAEAETKNKRMAKPSVSQISEYGKTLDPPFTKSESFVSFYESNGWRVGKNPMKDWKAAVRTWQQKDKETAKPAHRPLFDQPTYVKNGTSTHRPLWD